MLDFAQRWRRGSRRAAGLLLVLGAVALAASCVSEPSIPRVWVVASDLDNAPFAWVDGSGRPAGRDVEMTERLARGLGARVLWRRMPFESLLPAAEAGEVDVVCATLGVTAERAERVLFTRPYFETSLSIVVRAGSEEPRAKGQLAGRRVAAAAGTTSEAAVREFLPHAEWVFENKSGLAADARLIAGEVDAAVMDRPAAEQAVRDGGGLLRLIEPPLAGEHYALALPKRQRALRDRLDRELSRGAAWLRELDGRHGLQSAQIADAPSARP